MCNKSDTVYSYSLPPEKPPECSSSAWDELGKVIDDVIANENSVLISQNTDNDFIESTYDLGEISINHNLIENEHLMPNSGNADNLMIETTNNNSNEVILEITEHDKDGIESVTVLKQNLVYISHFPNDTTNLILNTDENEGSDVLRTKNKTTNEEEIENTENSTKKLTRKRLRNSENWKQNLRKTKRQQGEEYKNVKGVIVPKRSVQNKMCLSEKCYFKCSQKISDEERDLLHRSFWHLTDEKKLHFYSKHIKRHIASRKRTKNEISKKCYSYEFFFIVSGVEIRVCQQYFLNTLNISKQRVYYYFKKSQDPSTGIAKSPLQGKHQKKVISELKKDEVRNHIKSYPAVPSHYCRKSSNKHYLERNLTMRRMYEMYMIATKDPVKFNIYEQIFKTEFNISFFKPKKDICDKCAEYKQLKEPTPEEMEKCNRHIDRKNIGNKERASDRSRYLDDETVGVVVFDLQNTFSLPKSNVSKNFYKMKLACYNFTAHLNTNNIVYNAIWHEGSSGRAAIHIASALIRILKEILQDQPQLQKLILWSDSCVPQNKNSVMSFALQMFLCYLKNSNLEIIEQKFGEPGHGNVQEIDNAHSCIERYVRNIEIWSPLTLIRLLLRIPKSWKLKFKVIQMKPRDYQNYQSSSARFTYNIIPYTKVKQLIYEKANILNIKYIESFEGSVTTVKLTYSRRINLEREVKLPESVPQVEQKIVAISEPKKKHLVEMLPQMPEEERDFYYGLLRIKKN